MSSQTLDVPALSALFDGTEYKKDYGWAAIAGSVIIGFGHEPFVPQLAEAIVKQAGDDKDAQLLGLRKLREAMLKASPLVGFPRSINGLSILKSWTDKNVPEIAKTLESDKSLRGPVSLEERYKRGKAFFRKIYAQHTDRVLQNMNLSSGGDLGEFAISSIYGDLVAEESILNAKETGLMEFVCCLALGAAPQAKGHMYGSHNLGNNGAEIEAATKVVEKIAEDLNQPWSNSEGFEFLSKPKEKGW